MSHAKHILPKDGGRGEEKGKETKDRQTERKRDKERDIETDRERKENQDLSVTNFIKSTLKLERISYILHHLSISRACHNRSDKYHCPFFTDEENKAPKAMVTANKHEKQDLHPGLPDSKPSTQFTLFGHFSSTILPHFCIRIITKIII